MIYQLRKKFILISAAAVGFVFALIFGMIYFMTAAQLDRAMDLLTDVISSNGGAFPDFSKTEKPSAPAGLPGDGFFTPETAFSTRFFTVYVDNNNQIIRENTEKISSVNSEDARDYAETALERGDDRGWIFGYRYKITDTENGKTLVFVNGETNKSVTNGMLTIVLAVLIVSFLAILMLIILFSKRAVKPTAEAYEKQKQFVTDANHELKTPLTLILSNVDIVESEIGENEWLEDIRGEGERMGALINQLVTLSRMDEDESNLDISEFDLSAVACDTVSEFEGLAAERNKALVADVGQDIFYSGDEGMIRQLLSILLDNAVKYCDPNGSIVIKVRQRGRGALITAENSYSEVDNVELDRLFDRFYRADKARSFTGSFGVGLSVAQGIAKKHKGDITAYKREHDRIGFRVVLKRIK